MTSCPTRAVGLHYSMLLRCCSGMTAAPQTWALGEVDGALCLKVMVPRQLMLVLGPEPDGLDETEPEGAQGADKKLAWMCWHRTSPHRVQPESSELYRPDHIRQHQVVP